MRKMLNFVIALVLLSPAPFVKGSGPFDSPRKFDEFGDLNCEDEMARLDNFAIQLLQSSDVNGVIIFYGGRNFRGRLPRRGEAAARAARLQPYLVERRGIPAEKVIVIDGGYAKLWHVELWIIPAGASPPDPSPTVPRDKMRFRKGKVRPRDFRCRI